MPNTHAFFVTFTPKDRSYTIRWDADYAIVKDGFLHFEMEGEKL